MGLFKKVKVVMMGTRKIEMDVQIHVKSMNSMFVLQKQDKVGVVL